ncbi:MAG: hypothetical protein WCK70_14160 [Chloroflexales bacterium]|jgi:hypothetical protein
MYTTGVRRYLALALVILGSMGILPHVAARAAQTDRTLPASAFGLVTDGRWLAWIDVDPTSLTEIARKAQELQPWDIRASSALAALAVASP